MNKNISVLLIIFFTITLISCSSQKRVDIGYMMDGIEFKLVDKIINEHTDVLYTVEMINNTDYTIVQNTVLFSYPREVLESDVNTDTTRPFKILANNNKLNIEPGERVVLEFSFPYSDHEEFTEFEVSKANLTMIGYVQEVNETNEFSFVKSVQLTWIPDYS